MSDLDVFLRDARGRVDRHLDRCLPPADAPPARLHEAMRYAVFSGGKRLRPALAFAAARAVGAEPDAVLDVAAAVELVHAYSLVHDDLPSMDDDAERRGRATVHVKFGEANAILTGDALLTEAFGVLARGAVPAEVSARLAAAAGSRELVGGQVDDLALGTIPDLAAIESIHLRKTAALFRFAVWGAARAVGSTEAARLEAFARAYGLAFQTVDDLLDGDQPGECSVLRALGPADARRRAERLLDEARTALAPFGDSAAELRGLAEHLAGRLP